MAVDKSRPAEAKNMLEWVRPYLREGRLCLGLLDPRLEGQVSFKAAEKAFKLAAKCIRRDPKARPRMSEVVEILKPLPGLKIRTSSPSHFNSMHFGCRNLNRDIGDSNRLPGTGLSRSGRPGRSLSMPSSSNSLKSFSELPGGSTQRVGKSVS